ncbi:uncharacterized protein DS421_16g530140 [Arachis hypogaea]|nr:uncharacterized protein DS421_16g530140 [Arachis hypogaea]
MATMIAKGCREGKSSRVLYVSGEESLEQIGNRAERLRIKLDIYLYLNIDIEDIWKKAQLLSSRAMVVDSIQTLDPINTWLEQNVKLNDVKHKLKDQGRQVKVQQKRIGSTKKTIHALYKKLNLLFPSTLSDPAEDELGTGSSDDEDDNTSD